MSNNGSVAAGDVDLCPVCHEEIQIYAVGHCNHPVCFKCSVRMRFLCEQMYCPICRSDIKQVAFLTDKTRFEVVNLSGLCLDRKAMVFSQNQEIQDRYHELLKHRCSLCEIPEEFESFARLKAHVSKVHNLMCCKLCTDNLKLFSHERKFYSTSQMVSHKKSGDPDDKSYKGHPLCRFCDVRYFDNDALILHLRKDHFFCHFCEADGKTGEFYCHYEDLKGHFREEHFLCEEGECSSAQWTNAFKTDIDYRAHVAQTHAKGLDKQQTRRLKTLELNFAQPGRKNFQRNERLNRDQRSREEFQAAQALSATIADVQRQGNVQVVRQGIVDMIRGGQNAGPPPARDEPPPPLPTQSDFPDLSGRIAEPRQQKQPQHQSSSLRAPEALERRAEARPGLDRFALRVGRGPRFSADNGDFPSLPSQSANGPGLLQSKPRGAQVPMGPSKNPWSSGEAKAGTNPEARKNPTGRTNGTLQNGNGNSAGEGRTTGFLRLEKKVKVATATEELTPKVESARKDQPGKWKEVGRETLKQQPQQQKQQHQQQQNENRRKNEEVDGGKKSSVRRNGPKDPREMEAKVEVKYVGRKKAGDVETRKDEEEGEGGGLGTMGKEEEGEEEVKVKKEAEKPWKQHQQPKNSPVEDSNPSNGTAEPPQPLGYTRPPPPPGFAAPKHTGPPPGFKPRCQALPPPGFHLMPARLNSAEDFPALGLPSNPSSDRILKVNCCPPSSAKVGPSGTWSSSGAALSEIPTLDSLETPEQRMSRLVLVESDRTTLESLKLLLLRLNQGVTEPEDFYAECSRLLTGSVLAAAFRDIAACVRSPKDRAKVLAFHQRQVSVG